MTLEKLPKVRYATFEIWSNLGYKIIKGSKSFWIEGVSYFNEFQVIESTYKPKTEVEKLKERTGSTFANNYNIEDDIPF